MKWLLLIIAIWVLALIIVRVAGIYDVAPPPPVAAQDCSMSMGVTRCREIGK